MEQSHHQLALSCRNGVRDGIFPSVNPGLPLVWKLYIRCSISLSKCQICEQESFYTEKLDASKYSCVDQGFRKYGGPQSRYLKALQAQASDLTAGGYLHQIQRKRMDFSVFKHLQLLLPMGHYFLSKHNQKKRKSCQVFI